MILPMGLIYDAKQIALRDPAARSVAGVVLLYPGFHALVYYKISHFFTDSSGSDLRDGFRNVVNTIPG